MHNCIFTPHCTELECDRSCPILAETAYLLERNEISQRSLVFTTKFSFDQAESLLEKSSGKLAVGTCRDSSAEVAEFVTYAAICQNWKGSRLHCTVYNLKFSKYLEELKKSWTTNVSEALEYMQIWSSSAKVLIISNLDYVNWGDFESQTLLNLLQDRAKPDKSTVVICPAVNRLVSSKQGPFFSALKSKLNDAPKEVFS